MMNTLRGGSMETQAIDNQKRTSGRWLKLLFLSIVLLGILSGAVWYTGLYNTWFSGAPADQGKVSVAMLPNEPKATNTTLFAWLEQQAAIFATFEAQGAAVGDYLYVIGGFTQDNPEIIATTQAQRYHVPTDTWQPINAMPEKITHAGIAVDGDKIYLIGGFAGDHPAPTTAHVWIYNTSNNTWTAGPDLPAPRGAGAAAVVGRNLHFFGGTYREGEVYTDTVDHYMLDLDAAAPTWQTRAPFPEGAERNHIGGVALNGYIYAVGGQHQEDESWGNIARVDRYDPIADTWTRVADLPQARSHVSASVLTYKGNMIVVGGTVNGAGGGSSHSGVSIYDPRRNIWVQMDWLPQALKTPVAGIIDNTLIVATGYGSSPMSNTWAADLDDVWMYLEQAPEAQDMAFGGIVGNTLYLMGGSTDKTLAYRLRDRTWVASTTLALRPEATLGQSSAVHEDSLYVFGGEGAASSLMQVYSPLGNTWMTSTMPISISHAATLELGGKIYLIGGMHDGDVLSTTLSYEPATDTWETLAPLPQRRTGAILGTDGINIYLFGGRNLNQQVTSSVFIYAPGSNTWNEAVTTLPTPRSNAGRAIFIHNRFYLIGGNSTSWFAEQTDVYDPQTNTWSLASTIPEITSDFLVEQAGGMMYVVGGKDYQNIATPKVYAYLPGGQATTGEPTPTPITTPEATPTATLIPQTPTTTPIITTDYAMLLPYIEK